MEQKQLTAVTDALVRHDYVAALTSIGLDPFMGFLHVDRPNRPSLALDLTEEFRPWLADRLAITLINRQQISPEDFLAPEGGTVELTDAGRKRVIKAYQERKQETYDVSTVEKPGLGRLRFVGRLAEIGYKTRALGLPGRCGELVFAVDFTSLSDVPSVHWALAGTGHLPAATEGRSQTRREFSAAD
jgi:CRISPR-associated protein Cas1